MKRYTLNISFIRDRFDNGLNIVENFTTLREAKSYEHLIDNSVDRALIRDNVNGNVIWLKKKES